MKRILIEHATLIPNAHEYFEDATIAIEDGIILGINIKPAWESSAYQSINANGLLLMPGLIDVHVHGAMGADFIQGTQTAVNAYSYDAVRDGVTGFLTSLTVVSHTALCAILNQLGHAETPCGGARFLGIHSEGPYLDAKYKALMNETHLRRPDMQEMQEMIKAANGKLKMMTYSPKWDNADGLLEMGIYNHIAMMIGHTDADCTQAITALKNGASGFTHLYNAMSGHTHRHTGTVSASYFSKLGYAEIIADGVHIDFDVLRFTYQLLGSQRIVLITDAMPGKSMQDGIFTFSELKAVKKDGKAYVLDSGRLAGSVISLNDAMHNMHQQCGASYNACVEMACVNPAKLLNIDNAAGIIAAGRHADIVLFDTSFQTQLVMIDGNICFQNSSFI